MNKQHLTLLLLLLGSVLTLTAQTAGNIYQWPIEGAKAGEEGSGFMRMNLGCPRSVLEKALNQIKAAYDKIA